MMLVPLWSWGQKIEHGLKAGVNRTHPELFNLSGYQRHRSTDVKYAGAIGYEASLRISRSFGVAMGVENSLSRLELFHPGSHFDPIGVISSYISDQIDMYGVDIPIQVMLRGKRSNFTFLKAGVGVSYLYRSTRVVEQAYNSINTGLGGFTRIEEGPFELMNQNGKRINGFWQIAMGRSFLFKRTRLAAELQYRKEFVPWHYGSVDMEIGRSFVSFGRRRLDLALIWTLSRQAERKNEE
jgi:hypothetical protein